MREKFWENLPLEALTETEWEALCDGCGLCCLNKLEDEDSGEVVFTSVACRLFDDSTCQCSQYPIRHHFVPDCIRLTPTTIPLHAYWLPKTCAYKLRFHGKKLPDWHPLNTGDPASPHRAGISLMGQTHSEAEVPMEDWEEYVLDDSDERLG